MTEPRIPVVVHLTPEEHAALSDFVGSIRSGATIQTATRYLLVDYLASELGYDLPTPPMSPSV